MYRSVLRREPDDEGLAHYAGQLQRGRPLSSILEEFAETEEFRRGAKLFVPPGHFYSPVVHPREAADHFSRLRTPAQVTQIPGIDIGREAMLTEWRALLPFLKDIPFGAARTGRWRYGFENPAYAWGDGSILHAMLRRFQPRRLIEVGSGWSSACAIDTIENFLDGECEATFIEPYPALLEELLGETRVRMRILAEPIQKTPLSLYERLQAGDILFIDSTHIVKTGSDVCYEMFDILPRLAPGVLVHIHDVFWPFEYPRSWVVEENRSWNELYLLRAFLHANSNWRVLFFNDYMATFAQAEFARDYPNFLKNAGSAFWMQKR